MAYKSSEADFNRQSYLYDLPEGFIAQEPVEPRDVARLMILNRAGNIFAQDIVRNIDRYLPDNSVIVVNEVKVLPARFYAMSETGGKVEVLILGFLKGNKAEALMQSRRPLKAGERIYFNADVSKQFTECDFEKYSSDDEKALKIVTSPGAGGVRILEGSNCELNEDLLEKIGQTPLPPYICRETNDIRFALDKINYQTVFASKGLAVAAPTAGLHFTDELINRLDNKFEILRIVLNVGLGTFQPVQADDIRQHKMHNEYYEIPVDVSEKIMNAKIAKRPVIAIGTTTVRTLETAGQKNFCTESLQGNSDLFIYPGYKFQIVDGILTNFHLPGSTLIMMLAAYLGRKQILARYEDAINDSYRFYSYGDAMLIMP